MSLSFLFLGVALGVILGAGITVVFLLYVIRP